MTARMYFQRSTHKNPTLAYFLSIALLGTFTALGGPALPSLAENTSSSLDQISLYFVLGSLGYMLGSLLGGRAYDRLPGNRILALTLLVVAGSGAVIPTAQQLWWLLVVQFLLGLAQGANDVGCNTLTLWLHDREAGPYVNGLHFSFGVGTSLAPLVLAGFLALGAGFQWSFWVFSILSLPLVVWLWFLPDLQPPPRQPSANKPNNAVFPAAFLVLAFVFYVGAEVGFGNWVYTYALSRGMGTVISSAYLTSAFWGTFTAGRLLGVWVSSHLRSSSILTIDLLGCLASLSLIMLWPNSTVLLWLSAIGTGLFMASIFPTMLVFAGERLEISSGLTSWLLVGGGAGGMLLPWVIGQAFANLGSSAMPLLVLFSVVLNLILVIAFRANTPLPRPGVSA